MADKEGKKPKKEKKGKGEAGVTVSIAAHPRAKASIRRSRTRAAFFAFMLVLVLNLAGHQDPFDAIWRALAAGIVVNVIVWRCALVVWRHLILDELRRAEEHRAAKVREQRERIEQLAAEQAGRGFRAA